MSLLHLTSSTSIRAACTLPPTLSPMAAWCRSFSLRAGFPGMSLPRTKPAGTPTPTPSPPTSPPSSSTPSSSPRPPPPAPGLPGSALKVGPVGYKQWTLGEPRRYSWPLFGLSAEPPLPPDADAVCRAFFERGARYLGDHTTLCASDAPEPDWIEVAVMGRSNVGKSSLLNAILGSPDGSFVPVSKRPGSTVALDFYGCGTGPTPNFVLVDTPGYGYSAQGREAHASWMSNMSKYLRQRDRGVLARVMVLVDVRRGVSAQDAAVIKTLDEIMLPSHIVLTKADLVSDAELEQAAMFAATALSKFKTPFPVLNAVSSHDGQKEVGGGGGRGGGRGTTSSRKDREAPMLAGGMRELKYSLMLTAKLHKTEDGVKAVERAVEKRAAKKV